MISIRPGQSAEQVMGYLNDAAVGAVNLLGSGQVGLGTYLEWATRHLRTLGPAISSGDLDRLITTKRYWALLSAMPLGDLLGAQLVNLIALEVTERRAALEEAHQHLRIDLTRWRDRGVVMAVLDTTVLLLHGEELVTLDWHGWLNEPPEVPLVIWIPIAVVDELDRLKRDRSDMVVDGKRVPRRNLARRSLRSLEAIFAEPTVGHSVETPDGLAVRRLELRLLVDEPGHDRLVRVDAEIIDRAARLTPLAQRVSVVTFDVGMAFAARASGVQALRLTDLEG